MSDVLVLLFPSVHHVLRAERMLLDAGVEVRTKPVPRQLSSDCGICLFVSGTSLQDILALLAEASRPEAVYRMRKPGSFEHLWPGEGD